MPNFNGLQIPPYTDLRLGEQIYLWNNESPAAGANSIVITRGESPASNRGITFQLDFASAPTASVTIQGSNFTPPASGPINGITLATLNTIDSAYNDTGSYAFYWANIVSVSGGEPLTLIAQR